MGLPALTYFCKNGHRVAEMPEDWVAEDFRLTHCNVCNDNHFRGVRDWPQKGTEIVPANPSRHDGDIPVFDVNILFKDDKYATWALEPGFDPIKGN